jgi:hypothetical protein
MSTTTLNAGRKTLASQLDRLDTIIDGLADNLHEAVAMATTEAVKEVVTVAVQQAVHSALVEVLTNSDVRKRLAGNVQPSVPLMVRLVAKVRSCWSWLKSTMKGACSKVVAMANAAGAKVKTMANSVVTTASNKVHQAGKQITQRAKTCWMWTVALAALAKQFRVQLLVAVGIGVLVGVVCYLGGREIASLGCGLAGFLGSLATNAVDRVGRMYSSLLERLA